jgi:hypothetical protein
LPQWAIPADLGWSMAQLLFDLPDEDGTPRRFGRLSTRQANDTAKETDDRGCADG